jgi:hypothetical protein
MSTISSRHRPLAVPRAPGRSDPNQGDQRILIRGVSRHVYQVHPDPARRERQLIGRQPERRSFQHVNITVSALSTQPVVDPARADKSSHNCRHFWVRSRQAYIVGKRGPDPDSPLNASVVE